MQKSSFLNGGVVKWCLPMIEGSPPIDAPRLKRLALPQGELAHFSDGENIEYIAFVELRAGSTRGNHFHQKKEEAVYIIRGEMMLIAQDTQTGERVTLKLKTGDLAVVSALVAHVYQTTKPGDAVEFSKAIFDAADVYRFPLV
jgi:hypothetical protein